MLVFCSIVSFHSLLFFFFFFVNVVRFLLICYRTKQFDNSETKSSTHFQLHIKYAMKKGIHLFPFLILIFSIGSSLFRYPRWQAFTYQTSLGQLIHGAAEWWNFLMRHSVIWSPDFECEHSTLGRGHNGLLVAAANQMMFTTLMVFTTNWKFNLQT